MQKSSYQALRSVFDRVFAIGVASAIAIVMGVGLFQMVTGATLMV